jgi:hypothetical protein
MALLLPMIFSKSKSITAFTPLYANAHRQHKRVKGRCQYKQA